VQKRRIGDIGGDMGIGEDTEIRVRGSENGKKEVQGSGNVRGKDGVKLFLGEYISNKYGIQRVFQTQRKICRVSRPDLIQIQLSHRVRS
jgi:hypothetical protein